MSTEFWAWEEKYCPDQWDEGYLKRLVAAGVLTKAAYKRITGEAYENEEEA